MTEENFAWFAGIDWGSERHQACLVDAQGRIVGEREFSHGGKGLADLATGCCRCAERRTRWRWGSRCRTAR